MLQFITYGSLESEPRCFRWFSLALYAECLPQGNASLLHVHVKALVKLTDTPGVRAVRNTWDSLQVEFGICV